MANCGLTSRQQRAIQMFMICSDERPMTGTHDPPSSGGAPQSRAAVADRLVPKERRRGRGAATNASGRFEVYSREDFDDGWTPRGGANRSRPK